MKKRIKVGQRVKLNDGRTGVVEEKFESYRTDPFAYNHMLLVKMDGEDRSEHHNEIEAEAMPPHQTLTFKLAEPSEIRLAAIKPSYAGARMELRGQDVLLDGTFTAIELMQIAVAMLGERAEVDYDGCAFTFRRLS